MYGHQPTDYPCMFLATSKKKKKMLLLFALLVSAASANAVVNIKDCPGVVADGVTDDTGSIQKCIDAQAESCGKLLFPIGRYKLAGTVVFDSCGGQIEIEGEGKETVLLWSSAGDMFVWGPKAGVVGRSSLASFSIVATTVQKTANATAIRFVSGLVQSTLRNIMVASDDQAKIYPMNILDLGSITDTVQITDPLFQNVYGIGIKIGKGSEVRVVGGRIFGQFGGKEWVQGSIGVRVTGDNGGVHIISTDLIGLETGLLLENSNGQGSNREIFLSQATVDSNYRGMVVNDNSYIDFSGVWTASSGDANIYVAQKASPILSLHGGTIFNSGTYNATGNADAIAWHGLGSFILTGVIVRNNHGRGIWIDNPSMCNFVVSGCHFYGNGQNLNIVGDSYTITGSVFQNGEKKDEIGSAKNAVIANNIGL